MEHETDCPELIPRGQENIEKLVQLYLFQNEVAEKFRQVETVREALEPVTLRMFSAAEEKRCGLDGWCHFDSQSSIIALSEGIVTAEDEKYWKGVYLHELAHLIAKQDHTEYFFEIVGWLTGYYEARSI